MQKSTGSQEIVESGRWREFLTGIATGLELQLGIIAKDQGCKTLYPASPQLEKKIGNYTFSHLKSFQSNSIFEAALEDGQEMAILPLGDDLFIIACHLERTGTYAIGSLQSRAQLAFELVANFYTAFKEWYMGGIKSIELLTLQQMNQIILSFFQGECGERAIKKAFDLILSAVIILLDANGSWLELNDGISPSRFVIGNHPSTTKSNGDPVCETEFYCGKLQGRLGVVGMADHTQAAELLPFMVQECTIVLEVAHLFNVMYTKINQILQAIGSAIILVDHRGIIDYVNDQAENLSGLSRLQMIGKDISIIPGPWSDSLRSGKYTYSTGYLEPFPKNNELLWLDWRVCPLFDEDHAVGWLVLADDRSDYYRWHQEARKAERFATTAAMVGSLAHEIRNPLSAATGLLQILARKRDPQKVQGYSDLILRELDRITGLLNEFLLMGKPAEISPEPLDIMAYLQELRPLLDGEASHTGVEIVLDTQPVAPVLGDGGQLTQVIFNLVRNAIGAMDDAGTVVISTSEEDNFITLSVRDHGPGLTPEVKEHLFEPFFTTKQRGTGLGLPVVQAIVHNHGGCILADNAPGGGALFTVKLPKYAAAANGPAHVDVVVILSGEDAGGPDQALRSAGMSVISWTQIKDLDLLSRRCWPGVVLIDNTSMSKMRYNKIKELWPDVVIINIGKPEDNLQACGDVSVSRPLNYVKLIDKVRQCL